MRRIIVLSLFMLATLVWAAAQQPGTIRPGSGGQAASPSTQAPGAQVPDASQSQTPGPGSAGQAGEPGQMGNAPITEGCLGGSNPNYTITDTSGKTYKLNIPAGADASSLVSHIGEPVAVMGPVNKASSSKDGSIDVARIGRGTSKCPGSSPSGAQAPPKQ